jgi:hypothetical protein
MNGEAAKRDSRQLDKESLFRQKEKIAPAIYGKTVFPRWGRYVPFFFQIG